MTELVKGLVHVPAALTLIAFLSLVLLVALAGRRTAESTRGFNYITRSGAASSNVEGDVSNRQPWLAVPEIGSAH
jgi:hypothetical protein